MKIAIAMLILACTCLSGCAGQPPNKRPSLYEDFGGRKAIEQVVDLAIRRSHNDPRIAFHFDNTDDASFGEILFDQLCSLAEGPCQYDGMEMVEAPRLGPFSSANTRLSSSQSTPE
jgi:hemoglobin